MKVGIISDTHGDIEAWEKAMRLFEGCELILHAGDHLYHGAFNPVVPSYRPRELAEMMNDSPIPILHARGNCDSEVDQLALKDPILSPMVVCFLEGVKILVVHGHQKEDQEWVKTASGYGVDLLVRGHTHVPGIWRHGSLLVCNPGSPSLPKGREGATVAVLEDKEVSLLDLDGKVLNSGKLP
jgi:hypothetical protein